MIVGGKRPDAGTLVAMPHVRSAMFMAMLGAVGLGCGSSSGGGDVDAAVTTGRVQVILFTHIEDSTPGGALGTQGSRDQYLGLRARLIDVAGRARAHDLTWVLQPDWKYLEAARLYEDATTTADTGGKNLFRYLRDDLGAVIDPHSHENGGYNYTDVAYLLDVLEVGGSTVIGGHIWDPTLTQFQAWDRFRQPVAGEHYPTASWRGDILIGAGTPGHVNDPLMSGIWRPRARDDFFTDDPAGNIVAVGQWRDDVVGVEELVALYAAGTVAPGDPLTASWNINPASITAPSGPQQIDDTVFAPIAALRDQGAVVSTDFTSLVAAWRAQGATAFVYQP